MKDLTPRLLRAWPIPAPPSDAHHGRVLVVGGSDEMPGTVILAATAALRAGAGKVQIATTRGIAHVVGVAVPEARVFGLRETRTGSIAVSAGDDIAARANEADAVLIGPGMLDPAGVSSLLRRVLVQIEGPPIVLDAAALPHLLRHHDALASFQGRAVLTPHPGEIARMLPDPPEIPSEAARMAAERFGAVTLLKGPETFVAAPDGTLLRHKNGQPGLATSGSGDVLAGLLAGLLARGMEALHATAWAVHLHAEAGARLAESAAPLGFLARELLGEIPRLLPR
ncbi:MAG: NAD(P)H-hydrate dehydratase [Armatimonadetes bacterium]|nr:NAD(P)H-hydrate dehydratase [Armatimonadota bacterium]